jgi:glycosyltransferase involved in cell wall biosynthesis
MLHNTYLQAGGEDISFRMETELLRRKGHEVVCYEESNERVAELGQLRAAVRSIWSVETYREVRKVLQRAAFDVVHVQNFFPLISPSAYYAAAAEGVAVVQTLRNYRLQCLPGTLFRDGKVCEKCCGMSVPWAGIWHRCYRDSVAGSASVAMMIGLNKLAGTWQNKVDLYVALTDFARDRFVQGGIPGEKIVRKYNFLDPIPEPGTGEGGYVLFVGRFDPVKGIDTLLKAWETVAGRATLKIVGDGPLAHEVDAASRRLPGVERIGWQSPQAVLDLMGKARLVVVPSAYYEPFGRITAEAFAKGTPVVASRIAGMGELIDEGRTGFLFEPGNAPELAAKIQHALDGGSLSGNMRAAARQAFIEKFSADQNYPQMIEIYERAIQSRRRKLNG